MIIKTYQSNNLRSETLTRKSRYHQKIWNKINLIKYLPSERRYDLTISSQKKFLWFRVPKVGTRTILKIFEDSGVILDAEHPYGCYYPPRHYVSYYKFAFVRNPWDRVVSCWHDKVLKINLYKFSEPELNEMKDLNNFISYIEKLNLKKCDVHLRLQSSLIDLNNIDFLGRHENFVDDLSTVLNELDINMNEIPVVNKSQRETSDYREYFCKSSAKRIADLYAKDISVFGYSY